jgi:predicted Fe-S protein YdhL (DUF1289 family)
MPPVLSPCVKLCVLDAGGICEGCGRTIEEIAAWPAADDEARRGIVACAAARLQGMAATHSISSRNSGLGSAETTQVVRAGSASAGKVSA